MVGNQTLLWRFLHNKCFMWCPKKKKKPRPVCAPTSWIKRVTRMHLRRWNPQVEQLKLPPLPCAQGKGRRQSSDSPHHPWTRDTCLAGTWKRPTSFPSGVCREDGGPGVLDSVKGHCPVIMCSIPAWLILTDDDYFICFLRLIGCCQADLEVTVRNSVSWESSHCPRGVNDCNIWVRLWAPPGCW